MSLTGDYHEGSFRSTLDVTWTPTRGTPNMLFSIYPSDTADVREAVVAQALASGGGTVFTSLHIPETSGLERFGDYLADLHRRHGLTFCADVSPGTLGQLSCDIDDLGRLRGWGVDTVRIDFSERAKG